MGAKAAPALSALTDLLEQELKDEFSSIGNPLKEVVTKIKAMIKAQKNKKEVKKSKN